MFMFRIPTTLKMALKMFIRNKYASEQTTTINTRASVSHQPRHQPRFGFICAFQVGEVSNQVPSYLTRRSPTSVNKPNYRAIIDQ